jgi:SAM-dependent methyltransferase
VTAEQPRWPYDVLGELYDDDMGKNAPGHDVAFYVEVARSAGESVLELGCGTGRITLPLARAGLRVTGVDRSEPMLDALHRKASHELSEVERGRLSVVRADMRELSLAERFSSVLCPYSAFTYLQTENDRACALAAVRAHLAPRGAFVLDVFVPDPAVSAAPADFTAIDYKRQRADGTLLERSRTIRKDVEPHINLIERHYRVLDSSGNELARFTTESRIRYWFPDELRGELEAHGFDVVETSLDFGVAIAGERPKMAAFRCRAR